jgi:hypothetical protein
MTVARLKPTLDSFTEWWVLIDINECLLRAMKNAFLSVNNRSMKTLCLEEGMRRHCQTLTVCAVLSTLYAIIAPTTLADETSTAELEAAFAEADVNVDGYVDVDEYVAYMVRAFGGLDEDRDGYLVISDVPDVTPEKFASADRNNDGKVSLGEAVGDKMIDYFEIDQNEDGVISLEELIVYEQSKGQS